MAKPFRELREKMSPASQARAEAKAEQIIRDLPLAELRAARELTQTQLAGELGVTQAAISKLERRTDMYLSTLHHMIQAMGGELEIRAVFPDGQVRIGHLGGMGAPALAGSVPRRVLVIDQEDDVRRLVASVLRDTGYQVVTAHDGREALAQSGGEQFSLIVCDMWVGADGSSVVQAIRDRFGSACPPVMLTSDMPAGFVGTFGADAVVRTVLPKPFGRRQFRRAVSQVLGEADAAR
jgi:CheY-like chemotaxis protein/DNA-binding XRE family transcriptional regulator